MNNDMAFGSILIENEHDSIIDPDHEGCLHGKMYRRSIINKNNLHFNNLKSHEDNSFNQLYMLCCEKINFLDDIVYIYKYNSKSITRTKSNKKDLLDYIKSMTWLCEEINKRNFSNTYDIGRRICIIAYYCYFNYLLDTDSLAFIFNNMRIIKSTYLSYIDNLSYDDRVYLYKRFDYPIIPTITFFDFMNNITI